MACGLRSREAAAREASARGAGAGDAAVVRGLRPGEAAAHEARGGVVCSIAAHQQVI